MTDIEHAKKFAEESISLAISMYNPKAESIAETACLYGLTYKNKRIAELEKENAILKKALNLYVDWADECGIAWDNFPDMKEKWWKIVEEKGLGWIDGLVFMVTEEAKEQFLNSGVEK